MLISSSLYAFLFIQPLTWPSCRLSKDHSEPEKHLLDFVATFRDENLSLRCKEQSQNVLWLSRCTVICLVGLPGHVTDRRLLRIILCVSSNFLGQQNFLLGTRYRTPNIFNFTNFVRVASTVTQIFERHGRNMKLVLELVSKEGCFFLRRMERYSVDHSDKHGFLVLSGETNL